MREFYQHSQHYFKTISREDNESILRCTVCGKQFKQVITACTITLEEIIPAKQTKSNKKSEPVVKVEPEIEG